MKTFTRFLPTILFYVYTWALPFHFEPVRLWARLDLASNTKLRTPKSQTQTLNLLPTQ